MKLLAVMGGPRKNGSTFQAVNAITEEIKSLYPEIETEYINLCDMNIAACRGCRACFDLGEAACPFKDDVPFIAQKLQEAQGVIFSSPTFVANMTGTIKNLFDRLAYFCHRPAFFDKKTWLVSTTVGAGAGFTLFSMQLALGSMGFHMVCKTGILTHTGKAVSLPSRYSARVHKQAEKFARALKSGDPCKPTLFGLVSFRTNRKTYTNMHEPNYDAQFWKEKGWLESGRGYFTDAKPNPFQSLAATIISAMLGKG